MRHHLVSALTLICAGCGASPPRDLHAAFASIQVDEARIEHASATLESAGDEETLVAARDEICAAADHLAGAALPLDDRDARARSERASITCAAARERAP